MSAKHFQDSADHIFTEGTQFCQWGSGSERNANSWVGPKDKKACYIERSTNAMKYFYLKTGPEHGGGSTVPLFRLDLYQYQIPSVLPLNKITYKG